MSQMKRAQELLAQLAIKSPNEMGFSLQQGVIRKGDQIWVANNSALRTKIIDALHNSVVGDIQVVRPLTTK
jgi:hypothetical protein